MNKLILIIVVVAFVFILTYDPQKGKKLPLETYVAKAPVDPLKECPEDRYARLQALSKTGCKGENVEKMGVIYSSPNAKADLSRVRGFELEDRVPFGPAPK